jgi:hypothetical protein
LFQISILTFPFIKIYVPILFQNLIIQIKSYFILNQIIDQSGFIKFSILSQVHLGMYHFNPIPFQFKIKQNKGNLQCDNRDGVKVNKQAITTTKQFK